WRVKVGGTVGVLAALADQQWLSDVVQRIVAERGRLSAALGDFDWLTVLPSQTNFVLCRVAGGRAARAVKEGLERQGVLVRYFDKDGLRDCIRISVGRPEQTDAVMRALRHISSTAS